MKNFEALLNDKISQETKEALRRNHFDDSISYCRFYPFKAEQISKLRKSHGKIVDYLLTNNETYKNILTHIEMILESSSFKTSTDYTKAGTLIDQLINQNHYDKLSISVPFNNSDTMVMDLNDVKLLIDTRNFEKQRAKTEEQVRYMRDEEFDEDEI